MNDLFYTKIENIHQQITFQNNAASDLLYLSSHDSLLSLIYSFELPTIDEISGLIKQSKSSTCQLDPLPTLPGQSLFIFFIWYSLTSGVVPSSFKVAVIT